MAKVLNEERFNPSRLPGLSLWLDAQETTTIASTAAGVSSWSDRSDSGNTFTTSSTQTGPLVFTQQTGGFPTPTIFTSITSSADGTKLAACTTGGEGVYISTDSGTTWTPTSLALAGRPYQSITSSADGAKLAVVASSSGGGLFVSSNSGSTWTSISITGFTNLRRVVFSADGSTAALVLAGSLTGKIYVSTDSGITWVNKSTTGSGLPTTANWGSITSSANGSKLAAVVLGGGIYTSSNYGTTWVKKESGLPTTGPWRSITSSSDGKYLVAASNDNIGIYTSANSGENWTARGLASGLPGTAFWISIASSSDGKYLVAASDDKGIYTSVDYGENWTKQTSGLPTTANWNSITSSADGSKLAVVNSAGGIYTRSSFVSTWMRQIPCPIPLNWQTISSSADGLKLAAAASGGRICTSVDYGSTWTLRGSGLPSSAGWRSIASSADGIKLAAVAFSGYIYTSTDSGATWVTRTSGITPAAPPWICIASSADGTILAAVSGATSGRLYVSTNSGSSWTKRGETGNWNSIASSASGKNLAAAINSGGIYTSSDYGTTWVKQISGLPATETWRSITSSADGSKLAVLVEFGGIVYTSTDYGSTWAKQTSGLPSGGVWYSITSTPDWSKLAVAKVDGGIYISTDLGVTWVQQTSAPSAKWYSIAYSADGTTLAGVVFGGGVYVSYRPQYTPPRVSNTLTTQPSIFFPPGAQMVSTLSSGLGAPSIPGCTLWLDAADTATITSNATTGITQWSDKSGSGYNAIPAIFTIPGCVVWLSPGYYYQDGTVNVTSMNNFGTAGGTLTTTVGTVTKVGVAYPSCAYLSFAAGSSMSLPSITYTQTTRTVIAVVTVGAAGGIRQFLTAATNTTNIQFYSENTNLELNLPGYRLQRAPSPQNFFNSTSIICGTSTTADRGIFINGAAQTTDINDTGAYPIGTTTTQVIGNGGAAFDLYEMMVFDGALTASQRQQVEGYLAYKYNLQAKLPASHPYYTTPFQRVFTVGISPPNITTTTQNGINALATNSQILTINNFTWTSWATTFFVVKTPTNLSFFGGTAISSYAGYIATFNYGLYYTPTAGFNDSVLPLGTQVIPLNEWCIFSIGYGGGTQATNYAVNGKLRQSTTNTYTGGYQTAVTPLWISAWGPSSFYGGDNVTIGEVIQFNRSVTTQERQTIEGYLATKWGLRSNLPPTHPYSSIPYSGSFTLNPSGPVSKSIFILYQCPTTNSIMRFSTGNDISGQAFGFSQSNNLFICSPYQYGGGDTRWAITTGAYTLPTVLSAVYDAPSGMIRGDRNFNAGSDVRESALVSSIPNTPYTLGKSLNPVSVFLSASFHVCEIIAYNRALATTDRQMVEGYLAWKWGMTTQLPIGHPYQKFAPTGEQVTVPSTPSNAYSGLVSWIDMADSSTYTLSGNIVKTLKDKIGATSFTISGNTSGLTLSNIGTLPSINFTGNVGALQGPFLSRNLPVTPQGSAFAVLLPPASQVGATKLSLMSWGSPGNGAANPALGFTSQSSTKIQSYNTLTGVFYGPSLAISVTTPTVLFWAWYGGNMFYLASNGNTILSSPQTAGFYNYASTNNIFYIGNDGGIGASFNLGELCVYDSYVELPFRNILEGYLAWKWRLQNNLPMIHPYYYSSPTLQTLTEVNALSQPVGISGLTLWLDAADTTTVQQVNPAVTLTGSPTLLGVSNGYTYYAFKENGTITSATPLDIQYFAVGGGGGGGFDYGAGGGAGGLQTNTAVSAYLSQVSKITALVPGATYSITIGTGGAYQVGTNPYRGGSGGNTTFVGTGISVTANGGGGGGGGGDGSGGDGGSGGGGGYPYPTTPGGTGSQGGNGITGVFGYWGGAGGGIGGNATSGGPTPLNGGPGLQFFGTFYGGGGGGAGWSGNSFGSGGSGVGGRGAYGNGNSATGFLQGIPPVANSGGGGAGGGGGGVGTAGAAGIFIVGIPLTQTMWVDKSPVSNNLAVTTGIVTMSQFGSYPRPSVYFSPGTSATSFYNSGAESANFSAFVVASVANASRLLISTGQLTKSATSVAGQSFAFYVNNVDNSVYSPYVVSGNSTINNNIVGSYSSISGTTLEMFAMVGGTTLSGNLNFRAPLCNVINTLSAQPSPWVFGNCLGDITPKSFHVHEFITYSRTLAQYERQIIEGYLYWKWVHLI